MLVLLIDMGWYFDNDVVGVISTMICSCNDSYHVVLCLLIALVCGIYVWAIGDMVGYVVYGNYLCYVINIGCIGLFDCIGDITAYYTACS